MVEAELELFGIEVFPGGAEEFIMRTVETWALRARLIAKTHLVTRDDHDDMQSLHRIKYGLLLI